MPFSPSPSSSSTDMETSPQLLNDSFSYRWLTNSADTHDGAAAAAFIEIDPHLLSMRWSAANHDASDFDFGLLSSHSQVHADQIFSNGFLLPLRGCGGAVPERPSALRKSQSRNSERFATPSVNSSPALFTSGKSSPGDSRRREFEPARKKKMVCKYLCFLMPLLKMVKDLRLQVATSSSKSAISSCRDSARSSPRTSSALSSADWHPSNADVSIYDAVLHCKKSIGQEKYYMEDS